MIRWIVERFLRFFDFRGRIQDKRFGRLVFGAGAVLVFLTTYMLILPAISIDKETAVQEPGMRIAESDGLEASGGMVVANGSSDEAGYEADYDADYDADLDADHNADEDLMLSDAGEGSHNNQIADEESMAPADPDETQDETQDENQDVNQESEVSEDILQDDQDADANPDADANSDADTNSDADANSDANPDSENSSEGDAVITEPMVFTWAGDGCSIRASVDEYAMLPVGVDFKVKEIRKDRKQEKKDYQGYFDKALEEINRLDSHEVEEEKKSFAFARFFDISFVKDGKEFEPMSPVQVTITFDQSDKKEAVEGADAASIQDKEGVRIVHFQEDGQDIQVEEIGNDCHKKKENIDVSFEGEQFSVYGVVYTVDFFYEINGETFSYSMQGEDAMSLKDLVGKLHMVDDIDRLMEGIDKVDFSDPDLLVPVRADQDTTLGDLKKAHQIQQDFAAWKNQGEVESRNSKEFHAGDWALISLKPFDTKEKLTLSLNTDQTIEIQVTDAQDAPMQEDGIHVDTIPNVSGTTINLFDYWVDDSLKDESGRFAWPGYYDGWYYDDGNRYAWYKNGTLLGTGNDAGINKNHMLKFSPAWAGTVYDGTIPNKTNPNLYSPTRNPTNVSYANDGDRLYYTGGVNSYTGNGDPRQGLVESTLSGGYPKLTDNRSLGTNGESLAYLFKAEKSAYKDYYENVDHLLYVDKDGYYTYDSRDYKAELGEGNHFQLTEQTSDDSEIRGFWPFGQQKFWVGMHMKTQFSMPRNGQVLNPKDQLKDMQFEFSGDDDTWLYVDGVLVGDGGGIHNRTEIDVNFATGKAIVTGRKDAIHTGSFQEEKWLDDIFKTAGRYHEEEWEDIPGTNHKRFKAGTYHTFDMFYLERGGGESNLYIHYNLVSTEDFTAHKSYEGFADDERMHRDQFHFEMIGLDGQYQSVWNSQTQSATVTLLDSEAKAIMPMNGRENGAGTFEDPRKVYSGSAWTDSSGNVLGGTVFTTGVTENGDIRFGSANISAEEMRKCDLGQPSLYRYIIREIVPGDAVNEDGVRWDAATEEEKAAGGFVKDQVKYDNRIYYMTARVTSWDQTGADGQTYKAYGLSKTYYTDDSFSQVNSNVSFIDFRNLYAPEHGSVSFTKVDGANRPLAGAEFTLYTDQACTKVAKDLIDEELGSTGTDQVKTSGSDGKVSFDNLAAPKTYYMKETRVPDGYEANDTIYTVIIESSKDKTTRSRILVGEGSSAEEISKITNTKSGEISVIKEWRDRNGKVVDGGKATARVKLKRKKYVQKGGSTGHTVNFTIRINGRNDLVYTYTAKNIVGDNVTIDWWDTNQDYNSLAVSVGGKSGQYNLKNYWDNTQHKNRKLTIANVNSNVNVTVEYPGNRDWLFTSDHTPWMKNVTVAGSGPVYEIADDDSFNLSTDSSHYATLAAPNWTKTWTIGQGKDFPKDDGTHPYFYYITEVDNQGNEIEIGEAPMEGYILLGYSANNQNGLAGQGVITVVNQKENANPVNVRIRKTDDKPDSTNYLAGAVFRLETREDQSGPWQKVSQEQVPELDQESQFTVPETGIILTGLTDGCYHLVEITPPAGYIITEDTPVEFTVMSGTITGREGTIDSVRYTAATESMDAEFTIPNTPGAELPHTGGMGYHWIYVIGILLLGIAAMARAKGTVPVARPR